MRLVLFLGSELALAAGTEDVVCVAAFKNSPNPPSRCRSCDFDTAEPKPTMKENKDAVVLHSNGNGRDSDHLTSEISNRDYFFNAPEYECAIIVDGFADSKETEAKDSIMKATHFYTDKKVMECELPELIVCYKESTYHDIKDICVDNGVPSEKKEDYKGPHVSTKEGVDTKSLSKDEVKSSSCKDCGFDDGIKSGDGKKVDADKSSSESDSDTDVAKECGPWCPVEAGKENCIATVDDIIDDASREELVSNSLVSVKEIRPQTSLKALFESSRDSCSDVGQISCIEAVPDKKKSPNSILCYDSKVESGTITFNFRCRKSGSSTSKNPENVLEQPHDSQNEHFSEDILTSQVHRGEGESSFCVAGPSSGLITYSGQIPFSGSISLRSDSSTTSTRSFAFPILQPEWSSSPVRMAKADRRHFRKHRGWRHGLLCCRF